MKFAEKPLVLSAGAVAIAILLSYLLDRWIGSATAVLLLLQLAVVAVALNCPPRWSYLTAVTEALSYNYLFTSPRYSLQMFRADDIINLCVFVLVAIITSRLAEHYRRQQNALRQAELRNSILLSVSHDLRTPLATIIGTLSTFREYMPRLSVEEKQELLDSAMTESHRLHQYIENLLQATRLQHGALVVQKSEHSLSEVISAVLERFEEQAGRLSLHVDQTLPLLLVSPSLLQQAIFNVLDNALHYSAETAPVQISAYMSGDSLCLDVKDEGIGISAREAEHMFNLFYSASSPGFKNDGGTGLGLAVAKGIVVAHGGHIAALPASGGCLIRITLPVGGGKADG